MKIPFNKPYVSGFEAGYMAEAVRLGKLSADGHFTRLCNARMEQQLGFTRALTTTSCTSALEMAALLCNVGHGDEVIVPSYTFVSTALAFAKFGAAIRFADSLPGHPDMDAGTLEALVTPHTKAIVAVHYNGVKCDMETICTIARKYGLYVVEDAAHCVTLPELGHDGDLACYSFHETKNIHCGEGGLLGVNNPGMAARAENLWLNGTNRLDFERGETPRYEWMDTGGAYAIPELGAAFLWGQFQAAESIVARRRTLWKRYYNNLQGIGPELPAGQGSSHIFYLVCRDRSSRDSLIAHLSANGIHAPFHYHPLHLSPFGRRFDDGRELPNAVRFSECLLRLPLFHELTESLIDRVSEAIIKWDTSTL